MARLAREIEIEIAKIQMVEIETNEIGIVEKIDNRLNLEFSH